MDVVAPAPYIENLPASIDAKGGLMRRVSCNIPLRARPLPASAQPCVRGNLEEDFS
jgi:hypothetical protein